MCWPVLVGVVGLACASGGCSQLFGLEAPQLADTGGNVDADNESGDAGTCLGTGPLVACLPVDAPAVVNLDADLNTDVDLRCLSSVTDYCVIGGGDVSVLQRISVTGSRPLVLVARDTVAIDAVLDVGSRRAMGGEGDVIGAGAATTLCGGIVGETNAIGAGGGAGGSFGGTGGDGGDGDEGSGGTGGTAMTPAGSSVAVRGGCPGTRGGNGSFLTNAGAAGVGGGAVYVIAGGAITVTAAIAAGGMGGRGGGAGGGGGGGGGSGGMIVLDSPAITISGNLAANGGGGGEGGNNNNAGGTGASGSEVEMAASGATGNADGGDGGDGSFATALDGVSGLLGKLGGGGGGGGAGVIRVYPPRALTGVISPPLSL